MTVAAADPRESDRSSDRHGVAGLWAAVFLIVLSLYGLTACRDIQWQDSGQFVLRVVRGEVTDPFGLALAHPLHFWISTFFAKVLPFAPPFSVALVSALFGAIGAANVFGIVHDLTGSTFAALLATAALALGHTYWRFSTFVEVYSISAAMWTAEFWALVRWDRTRRAGWLILMFLANGVGLADHDMALLTLPVIGIVLLLALRSHQACLRTLVLSAIAWLIGASPFLGLVMQQAAVSGNIVGTIHSALFGNYQGQVLAHRVVLPYTAASIAFTLLSFPNLTLPAAVLGLFRSGRLGIGPVSRWVLTADLVMHLGFVLRYAVIDQYTFLVPAHAMLAVFAGLGFAVVLRTWRPRARNIVLTLAAASIVLTPAVYVAAAKITRSRHLLGHYARNKPYRDDYRYLFLPWGRGEHSAAIMSEQAVTLADGDGLLIVPDEMGSFAIDYQLFRRGESNVRVIDHADPDLIRQYARSDRPVVLVPAHADDALPAAPLGSWKPIGELYLLAVPANATTRSSHTSMTGD